MSTHHQPIRFSLLLCWLLLTVGWGLIVPHTAAFAAALFPPSYSLGVTESISTMTYGGTAPTFQAQLTVPAGENPLQAPNQFWFHLASQDFAPDTYTSSGSTYTFTLKGSSIAAQVTLLVGTYSAVANYFSSVVKQTLTSAPVTLTVQKFTPTISCSLNAVSIFAVNASVNFSMGTQNGPAIDWQDATYSITFVGPQTFTDSNLTASSSGQGTASVPSVPGTYKYRCTFSGTANFNAAQTTLSTATLIVTQGHQVGIKLYSTPTTIVGGHTITLEIVVSGGSELPTPTGSVALFLGPYNYTSPFHLSGGRVTVQVLFPSPLPSQTLRVYYYGDADYAQSSADFPLTNPPIPGGANPTPTPTPAPTSTSPSALTPTPSAGSTPTPSGTAIASGSTPTPSSTTTNGGTIAGSPPPPDTSTQGSLVFWIGLVILLVLAAGGSGVFLVLRKRARGAIPAATVTLPPSSEE